MKNNNKKIWTVLDVENEIKDIAKKMAKINKKKIGAWLTELILRENNTKSAQHVENNSYDSIDMQKILRNQDEILMKIQDLNIELANISHNLHPLPKQSFIDKIFGK